ncbi:MAG: DUF6692 family protein, partial [Pseudomonadota bacterium]|nr:DUF6692 family protein [Pseudomonadota bacterium]
RGRARARPRRAAARRVGARERDAPAAARARPAVAPAVRLLAGRDPCARGLVSRADPAAAAAPELTDAAEALSSEVVKTVDPEFLTEADIAKVFPDGVACRFTYTETSPPVLVTGDEGALIRISGDLVRLEADGDGFEADPLTAKVNQTENGDLQDLIVTAGPDYTAGFRGQFTCAN